MRIRDHNKGDLALAALTLTVAAAAAGNEAVRWARRRVGSRPTPPPDVGQESAR